MSDGDARRAAFLAAWRSHGNVRRAMRESGVGSPTTAYRWIRAWQQQPAGGVSVHRAAPRIDPRIADAVIALRQAHPTWGKQRIAHRLAARHGGSVISPTGVRSVLREAGLWSPPPPLTTPARVTIDADWLVDTLQRGVRLDLRNDPRGAVDVLRGEVWRRLEGREAEVAALLREPEAGSWLLRGTVQLAHALIDTGRWASALWYLRLLDDWLRRHEDRRDPRRAAYQDAGDRWVTPEGRWSAGDAPPAGVPLASLREDEIWLETQQYLGVVLRGAPGEPAIDALAEARHALRGRTGRTYPPARRLHYQAVIAHDLAAEEQREGYAPARVLADLAEAEALLREDGDRVLLATAAIARARALAAAGATTGAVERAVWEGFERAEASPALVVRVTATFGGAALLAERRELDATERSWVVAAARLAVARGFADQARKALEEPALLAVLGEVEAELRRLVEEL